MEVLCPMVDTLQHPWIRTFHMVCSMAAGRKKSVCTVVCTNLSIFDHQWCMNLNNYDHRW